MDGADQRANSNWLSIPSQTRFHDLNLLASYSMLQMNNAQIGQWQQIKSVHSHYKAIICRYFPLHDNDQTIG